MFKPNLIKGCDDFQVIYDAVKDNLKDWVISLKKDGVRMELDGKVLGRSLKPPGSKWVSEKFKPLAEECKKAGVVLEGEFYSHGMRFPEINRFYKTTDVRKRLEHLKKEANTFDINNVPEADKPVWKYCKDHQNFITFCKDPYGKKVSRFELDWPGRTPEFLSTYHDSLKVCLFDCYFDAYPDLPYSYRLEWMFEHVSHGIFKKYSDLISLEGWYNLPWKKSEITTIDQLVWLYNQALNLGWEGLILSHKDRVYKMGRSTLNEATIFKMKEDKLEFDGEVLDIEEGTVAREGAPKSTNELGRSVTSKLKDDRVPSGIASGIVTNYEGHEFTVSFKGYSHDELKEILENKKKYIGRWFKYHGMKPVKSVPRHAHMERNSWRDGK